MLDVMEEFRKTAAYDASVRIREVTIRLLNIWYDSLAAKMLNTIVSPCESYEAFSQEPCEEKLEKFLNDFLICKDTIKDTFSSVEGTTPGDIDDSDDKDSNKDIKSPNRSESAPTSLLSIGPPHNPFEINDRMLQLFTFAIQESMETVDRMVKENQIATGTTNTSEITSPGLRDNTSEGVQDASDDVSSLHTAVPIRDTVTEDTHITHKDDICTQQLPVKMSMKLSKSPDHEEREDNSCRRYNYPGDEFNLLPVDISSVGNTPVVPYNRTPTGGGRRPQLSATVTPIHPTTTTPPSSDIPNPSVDLNHIDVGRRVITEGDVYDTINPGSLDLSAVVTSCTSPATGASPRGHYTMDPPFHSSATDEDEVLQAKANGIREYRQLQKEKKEKVAEKIGSISVTHFSTAISSLHGESPKFPSVISIPFQGHYSDQTKSRSSSKTNEAVTSSSNNHPAKRKAIVVCNKHANSDGVVAPSKFYDPTISSTATGSKPSRLTIDQKRRLYNEAVELERVKHLSALQLSVSSSRVIENQVNLRYSTEGTNSTSLSPDYNKEAHHKINELTNRERTRSRLRDAGDDSDNDRLGTKYLIKEGGPYLSCGDISRNLEDINGDTDNINDTRHIMYSGNTHEHIGSTRLGELMDKAADLEAQMAKVVNSYYQRSLHQDSKRRRDVSADGSGKKPLSPSGDPRYYALNKQLQRVRAEVIKEQREVGKVLEIERERAQQKADLNEKRRIFRR
eukprot:Tbor_TRINITY_DN4821_c0_g1::TRINITY_DN4821_c0_g1_i1::g.1504::m.1504